MFLITIPGHPQKCEIKTVTQRSLRAVFYLWHIIYSYLMTLSTYRLVITLPARNYTFVEVVYRSKENTAFLTALLG